MDVVFGFNKTYNFATLAPAILGNTFTNVKVIGILTADNARKYEDIYTIHNSLIGVIPSLPQSASGLTFLLFENNDGTTFVLANEYIDQSTITEVTTINIRIELLNLNTTDAGILRTRLLELGYSDFTLITF